MSTRILMGCFSCKTFVCFLALLAFLGVPTSRGDTYYSDGMVLQTPFCFHLCFLVLSFLTYLLRIYAKDLLMFPFLLVI